MNYLYYMLYAGLLLLFPFAGKAAEPDWSCDVHAYQYDMSLYLALQRDNQAVTGDFVVAAFCDEECRGVAELQSVGNTSFYYMRVRSNSESGEILSFKVYDRSEDKEVKISGSLRFVHLQQVGFPSQPWLLTLPAVVDSESGLDGIDENTQGIVLTGSWTQEKIDELEKRLHGETGGTNTGLSSVDMSEVVWEENVSLDGLFAGCDNLTSVVLPDLSSLSGVSTEAFAGSNPNCLVFLANGEGVPDVWSEDVNVIIAGEIDQLKLLEDKPFSTPFPFKAKQAVYQRTFTNNRPQGVTTEAGWETICLPFAVESVCLGEQELFPMDKDGTAPAGDFYMATLTSRGFELLDKSEACYMEANRPYLLNMVSPEGTSIEGIVSFMASGEIQIMPTQPYYIQESNSFNLVGTFTPFTAGNDVYEMNEEGNAFVRNDACIPPFEAYLQAKIESSSSIPVVLFVPISGIHLAPSTVTVEEDKTIQLSATIFPENATNKNVVWTSSNERAATVSSSGMVRGVKEGTTTITVRTEEGGFTAVCAVTVIKKSNPDNPDGGDPDDPTANENMETLTIQVYPTQVSDYVHVGVLPAKSRLALFDLAGRQVKQVAPCEGDVDFYMGDQPSGIYLLYILVGEEQKKTVKLIKK
ncbi:Ig-like domain-containing protein [Parabacteroides johnsonii]